MLGRGNAISMAIKGRVMACSVWTWTDVMANGKGMERERTRCTVCSFTLRPFDFG